MASPNKTGFHCYDTPYHPSLASQGPAAALTGAISFDQGQGGLQPYTPAPPAKKTRLRRNPQPWDQNTTCFEVAPKIPAPKSSKSAKQKTTSRPPPKRKGAGPSSTTSSGLQSAAAMIPKATSRSPLAPLSLNPTTTSAPQVLQPVLTPVVAQQTVVVDTRFEFFLCMCVI